ncbi:MAG: phage tail protein [Candidatus Viridilinea halotolerans]|uniref:Phage tail protein n=1 Tax=Candidatus Viridilinea halotolerans TaxID=2491704 RepID=A0A426U238_9CHLR|nr:MAG: phage tail protein [Candidatus Viridilinea halotolerans]
MTTDPFRTQTFYLEIEPHFSGAVLKVMGLGYEREAKKVHQAIPSGMIMINQLPGNYKPGVLTIHKAVTANKGFWDWRKKVLEVTDMSEVRVNATITAYDYANGGAKIKWNLLNVWPSRIKGPVLNIAADIAIEEVDLCYEQLQQSEQE